MATVIRSNTLSDGDRKVLAGRQNTACSKATKNETQVDDKACSDFSSATENLEVDFIDEQRDYQSLLTEIEQLKGELEKEKAQSENYRLRLEESESSLETLYAEREENQKQGFETGRADGFESGSKEALEQAQQEITQLNGVVNSVKSQFAGVMLQVEEEILDIAFHAVIKLIGDLHSNRYGNYREYLKDTISETLKSLDLSRALKVHLSPSDYELIVDCSANVRGTRAARSETLFGLNSDSFVCDASIEVGGCIIKSSSGTLDARLEERMNRLKMLLLDKHHQRIVNRNSVNKQVS